MGLTLVIGNKNYSSWSFRPWFAMKAAGIDFEEVLIPLFEPGSKEKMLSYSPAGKVPALMDGDVHVWESLAILEYLADKFPAKNLWPSEAGTRAHARAISAEMHAGFQPLRKAAPMNMWRPVKALPLDNDVKGNVARIDAMWAECRARYGKDGPFLFGKIGNADAMYAPVVSRFHTYDIKVSAPSRAYMDAVMSTAAWKEWYAAGVKEPWAISHDEIDWPTVLKV